MGCSALKPRVEVTQMTPPMIRTKSRVQTVSVFNCSINKMQDIPILQSLDLNPLFQRRMNRENK